VTSKDLLVHHYQHLLEVCLKAGAADMSTIQTHRSLVSFPVKLTCLFTQSANLQAGQEVSGDHLFKSSVIVGIKTRSRCSLASRILLVTPFPLRIYRSELTLS